MQAVRQSRVLHALLHIAFTGFVVLGLIGKVDAQSLDSVSDDELKDSLGRASPQQLASSFVGLVAIVTGPIGTMYDAFRRSNNKPPISLTHVFHNEDGSTRTITITKFEDLERFVTEQRKAHALYVTEIRRRGYEKLKPAYRVTASVDCPSRFLSSGEATAEMNEFLFRLTQQGNQYTGIIVQTSVAFQDRGLVTLVGDIVDGKISVRDPKSSCEITLAQR
jgi:hypothetical protein